MALYIELVFSTSDTSRFQRSRSCCSAGKRAAVEFEVLGDQGAGQLGGQGINANAPSISSSTLTLAHSEAKGDEVIRLAHNQFRHGAPERSPMVTQLTSRNPPSVRSWANVRRL